jgi:hypothetical protein
MIWLPQPPPSLSRQLAPPATHRKTEKERQVADSRGMERAGEEPNHTTTRKPGPLQLIQYTLSKCNAGVIIFFRKCTHFTFEQEQWQKNVKQITIK